jgi:hypothetical protein
LTSSSPSSSSVFVNSSEPLWLSDMARGFGDSARVFTYGYDADILFTQGDHTSGGRIAEEARSLLQNIVTNRKRAGREDKPIMFVGHSLGGLIIKQALVEAANDSQVEEAKGARLLRDRTYEIISLAANRRGSALSSFSLTTTQLACWVVMSKYRPSVELPSGEEKLSYYRTTYSCLELFADKDTSPIQFLSSLGVADILSSFPTAGRHILSRPSSVSTQVGDILNPKTFCRRDIGISPHHVPLVGGPEVAARRSRRLGSLLGSTTPKLCHTCEPGPACGSLYSVSIDCDPFELNKVSTNFL